MRISALGGTSLQTSSLGLGSAGLFSLPSRRARVDLVRQALDEGILHFDTAPMYGLGAAESELAAALGRDRERVTIATKFGIEPRWWVRTLSRVQAPARAIVARSQGLKAGLQAQATGPGVGVAGSLLYRSTGYTGSAAKVSITSSLRRLGIDYIDLVLLHDPSPGSDIDDLCAAMDELKERGDVRAWGVAGEVAPVKAVIDRFDCAVPVAQVGWNIFQQHALPDVGSAGLITFGAIGGALPVLTKRLREDRTMAEQWATALGTKRICPEFLARLLLADATDRNKNGITLFSTTRSDHLTHAARHAADPELAAVLPTFRELL